MAPARRSHVVSSTLLLILAVLACVEIAADGWTMCESAKCGKGRCDEVEGLVATYKCTCDPGTFDAACYNVSLLPRGIPLPPDFDPCVAVNCGPGECKRGEGVSYACQCHDGYVNFLNLTSFPCVKNCFFGMDCSKLMSPPPPPPSTAPLPPPGSASSWQQLLLLLLSLAMVHQLM